MVSKNQSVYLWIFAVVFTVSIAIYQKATGPSYPKKGKVEINGKYYKYKLLTSFGGDKNAPVKIEVPENIDGIIKYKKYPGNDEWQEIEMKYDGEYLIGYLPHQPPAGKLEYMVSVSIGDEKILLKEDPVIIRFKGGVPLFVLIPHIIFMFMAMLFSTRTGIEALRKGHRTYKYALITFFSLLIGGLILGPVVQKYAFGDYWTGWPFGGDWTDNKTIFAFLFWLIAVWVLRRNKKNRLWPIIAA
ncbi:MAG: hypothetical protein K8R68_10865, partial [Bacteroidales bacterium]|nr:hypothetical protein [Bacteroidales bacterium]